MGILELLAKLVKAIVKTQAPKPAPEPTPEPTPEPEPQPEIDSEATPVSQFRDGLPIPDVHNTGCKGELRYFNPVINGQGVQFGVNTKTNSVVLEFDARKPRSCFANLSDGDTITFSDYDFTNYGDFSITAVDSYNSEYEFFRKNITLVFINCLFPMMKQSYEFTDTENIHLIFKNCTMAYSSFGNAEFENCLIGNRSWFTKVKSVYCGKDGINPCSHSTYRNCYIMDLEYETEEKGAAHIDGCQTYPEREDVHFFNCRFECFDMPYNSFGGWSYCMYFEKINVNSSIDHCIFHGGGYYQTSIRKAETVTATNNLISRDYRKACYPNEDTYQMTDKGFAEYIDTLLVSSIWVEDGFINIMCSNTEHTAKTLRVATDTETEYRFEVKACPTFLSEDKAEVKSWSDLPIDVVFKIPKAGIHKIECYEDDKLLMSYETEEEPILYEEGIHDIHVIPDKYNTGCDKSLINAVVTKEDRSAVADRFDMRADGVVGFRYMNTKMPANTHIVVENTRFEIPFKTFDTEWAKENIKFTFNNCEFMQYVSLGWCPQNVSCEFNNCTMKSITGGDFTLNKCYLGSKISDDAMQISGNVEIRDTYVADLNQPNTTGDYTGAAGHVDGIQFRTTTSNSGTPSVGGHVHLYNMRFELPQLLIPSGYSNGYVNACIMTEYKATIEDFSIENCHMNGGGYTLYLPVSNTYDIEMTVKDVYIGCSMRYGKIYKYGQYYGGADSENANPKLDMDNIVYETKLYVSSVWKEDGKIHVIVTNDTNYERTLVVRTSDGDKAFVIPKCPSYDDLRAMPDNGGYEIRFKDLPFDLDKVVESDSNYVVCFDNTEGEMEQIRYKAFD